MDIVISAAQGGGKTKTATALVRFFTRTPHANKFNSAVAYWVEPNLYSGARIPVTEITRAILQGTRSDIIVIDEAPDWALEHLKVAVQEARKMLRRNILAIYCVQDRAVGVSESRPWVPAGFVSELTFEEDEFVAPAPEQFDSLRNAIKEGGRSMPVLLDRTAVDGITEQSIGEPYIKEAPELKSLVEAARRIRVLNWDVYTKMLEDMYKHFGVDCVVNLPPFTWPEAARRMDLILKRNHCREILVRGAKAGASGELRKITDKYGSPRLSQISDENIPQLYAELCELNNDKNGFIGYGKEDH